MVVKNLDNLDDAVGQCHSEVKTSNYNTVRV